MSWAELLSHLCSPCSMRPGRPSEDTSHVDPEVSPSSHSRNDSRSSSPPPPYDVGDYQPEETSPLLSRPRSSEDEAPALSGITTSAGRATPPPLPPYEAESISADSEYREPLLGALREAFSAPDSDPRRPLMRDEQADFISTIRLRDEHSHTLICSSFHGGREEIFEAPSQFSIFVKTAPNQARFLGTCARTLQRAATIEFKDGTSMVYVLDKYLVSLRPDAMGIAREILNLSEAEEDSRPHTLCLAYPVPDTAASSASRRPYRTLLHAGEIINETESPSDGSLLLLHGLNSLKTPLLSDLMAICQYNAQERERVYQRSRR